MLVFNDRDQIVISNVPFFGPGVGTSFLVPEAGTRIDLATLVTNLPSGLQLDSVVSIDDQGNLTGIAADAAYVNFFPFLLKPLGNGEPSPGSVTTTGAKFPSDIAQTIKGMYSKK